MKIRRQTQRLSPDRVGRCGGLVRRNPADRDIKSNLAASYTHRADLEVYQGSFDAALADYQSGIQRDEELLQGDPTNPFWQIHLAPLYKSVGDILDALNRKDEALTYYEKHLEATLTLALRDQTNAEGQVHLANAAKTLGDHSSGLAQIGAYRMATRVWKRLIEYPQGKSRAASRYDDLMRFGAAFDAQNDWPDARTAYQVAEEIARANIVKNAVDASWKEKAEAAAKAAAAAHAPVSVPPAGAGSTP